MATSYKNQFGQDVYDTSNLKTGDSIDASGNVITAASLTPTTAPNFTQPADVAIPDISKIDTKIDTKLQDTATQSAPVETNISDLLKRITEEQNAILGESAFTAEQQKAQGISDLTAKQNDLVAQIQSFQTQSAALENQKTLAEERIMQESEGRGRTAGGIAPLTASAQRKITLQQADIASQALIAQAALYGTQGKLATANMLVKQAVDVKFGAQKEKLAADIANLNILIQDPALDKAIKDRAAAQLAIKTKQDAELAKTTKDYEEAQKEVLKYSGIADSVTLAEMSKAKTALEVAQIAAAKGLKTLEQQKAEKELVTFGDSAEIKEFNKFFPGVDVGTPAGRQQYLNWKAQVGAAGRKGEEIKPLDILDVQRYNELYPNAGVVAGDTQAQANAKIAATNTPEAKTRNLIVAAKDNGNSYETIIAEINKDTTITDKALAIKIVDEVYGKVAEPSAEPVFGTGNFAKTSLGDELKRLQDQNTQNGFPINTGVREQLARSGYPISEIDALMHPITSGISNFVNSISNFLFK